MTTLLFSRNLITAELLVRVRTAAHANFLSRASVKSHVTATTGKSGGEKERKGREIRGSYRAEIFLDQLRT
jgi:hypothetical protein